MKTLIYVILLLIVLAAIAGGIYYLVTQVDYSGVTDTANSAVNWVTDKVNYIKNVFS